MAQRASTPEEIRGPVHKGAALPHTQVPEDAPTPGKTFSRSKFSKSGTSVKPGPAAAINIGSRLAKGSGHAFEGATKNNGGITAIMAAVFAIVALAKIRGGAQVSTSHALFGGFVVLFVLTLMYKMNPRIALAFAVLILVQALLEYGQAALSGLGSGGSGLTAGGTLFAPGQAGNPEAPPGSSVTGGLLSPTPGAGGTPGGSKSGPDPLTPPQGGVNITGLLSGATGYINPASGTNLLSPQ